MKIAKTVPERHCLSYLPCPPTLLQRGCKIDRMGSAKVNGDAAALKKRKREKADDRKVQKKTRHQDLEQSEELGTETTLEDGQLQAADSEGSASRSLERIGAPQWRLSNPMGGRMLDIDPVFSVDEK